MSFLAPLFLLGGLAVALPVIFHLIRRTTRQRTPFSSLMFLLPTPPRLTRRSRLEHLLLLALRCLAIGLLTLGFARPFIKHAVSSAPEAGTAKRIVVLVDTSASMRRANLWSDARNRVDAVLRTTSPADSVAISTFDREVHPLVSFDQWNSEDAGTRVALAEQRLAATSPGWSSTHLGNALISAAETLADTDARSPDARREIVLVSDLQAGSRLDQLQGYEWPKGIQLVVERLAARNVNNAAIQLVTSADDSDHNAVRSIRVRVSNAADSRREEFKIGWAHSGDNRFVSAPVQVYVPPGQSRIVPLPAPAQGTPADRVVLQGDDENFDNTIFVTPPEIARPKVLYLGADSATNSHQPLYFLERAFQDTGRQAVEVLDCPPSAPLPAAEEASATLFVAGDALPEARARSLHDRIAAGKTLLFVLKNTAAAPTLAMLCGMENLDVEEGRPASYAMLDDIDFRHPVFAPFADPRFSDFTRIHFWSYRRLQTGAFPGARVLARFDSGDPALLEVPVGRGRVLVLASGWQPEDSQLALSTKFVPLLYSILDYSGAPPPPPVQYYVGDVVPLRESAGEVGFSVRTPDGSVAKLATGETNFSQTLTPGIYTVTTTQPPRKFAVNLDASESRTAPLPVDELEQLGAPVARQVASAAQEAQRKVRLEDAALENRQKLWRWFIVLTLAVLLVETWLAGRTARRVNMPLETTA